MLYHLRIYKYSSGVATWLERPELAESRLMRCSEIYPPEAYLL